VKAAVIREYGGIAVENVPEPTPGPGEVLLAPQYTGICGTDAHVFRGEFAGRVTLPLIPGHEFSALVEEVGEGVDDVSCGDRVTVDPIMWCGRCPACLYGRHSACRNLRLLGVDMAGGLAERVVAHRNMIFKLPPDVDMRHAAMTEVYSIGMHATRTAQVDPGDVVVILGAGKVGLCVLEVMKETAALMIVAVDVEDKRLAVARKIGAHVTINAREADPEEEVARLTEGRGADRVVEVVGEAVPVGKGTGPMSQAAAMVRSAGRVVVLGQGRSEQTMLWKPFVWKEAEIKASRVTLGEFPRTVAMMNAGRFNPGLLITHEFALDQVDEAFEWDDPASGAIKVLVRIGSDPA